MTAVLVVVTPAKTEADPGVVERIVELGDAGSVQLTVAPAAGRASTRSTSTSSIRTAGPPRSPSRSRLVMSLPSADLGPITRETLRAGPGALPARRRRPGRGRHWTIEVRARVDRFTEEAGATEVPIAP